jgi:hypothetical protein
MSECLDFGVFFSTRLAPPALPLMAGCRVR